MKDTDLLSDKFSFDTPTFVGGRSKIIMSCGSRIKSGDCRFIPLVVYAYLIYYLSCDRLKISFPSFSNISLTYS